MNHINHHFLSHYETHQNRVPPNLTARETTSRKDLVLHFHPPPIGCCHGSKRFGPGTGRDLPAISLPTLRRAMDDGYVFLCVEYVKKCLYIILYVSIRYTSVCMHIYIYIYTYIRATPGFCPGVAA